MPGIRRVDAGACCARKPRILGAVAAGAPAGSGALSGSQRRPSIGAPAPRLCPGVDAQAGHVQQLAPRHRPAARRAARPARRAAWNCFFRLRGIDLPAALELFAAAARAQFAVAQPLRRPARRSSTARTSKAPPQLGTAKRPARLRSMCSGASGATCGAGAAHGLQLARHAGAVRRPAAARRRPPSRRAVRAAGAAPASRARRQRVCADSQARSRLARRAADSASQAATSSRPSSLQACCASSAASSRRQSAASWARRALAARLVEACSKLAASAGQTSWRRRLRASERSALLGSSTKLSRWRRT